MSHFDWSKAPEWATCVVENANTSGNYHWCEAHDYRAKIQRTMSGLQSTMLNPTLWAIVEYRPVEQPSTAPDLLNRAAQLLAERGKQYDKSGEERSAAAIVAAFNIITKRDLTPGEGWLFMVLLKAVRFYSNTETPHRDSLEDMIAFAALHAEEYLNDK